MTDNITVSRELLNGKCLVDISLLRQVLDALREIAWSNDSKWQSDRAQGMTEPLRAALEQPAPVQEPAAEILSDVIHRNAKKLVFTHHGLSLPVGTKLYTATQPAPSRKPEGGKRFHAKFNVGDRVWYMKDNKPTEVVISAIEIFFVNTNQDRITYNAKNVTNSVSWLDNTKLQEACLFKSKAELLESL